MEIANINDDINGDLNTEIDELLTNIKYYFSEKFFRIGRRSHK